MSSRTRCAIGTMSPSSTSRLRASWMRGPTGPPNRSEPSGASVTVSKYVPMPSKTQ